MTPSGVQHGPLRPDYGPEWAELRCDTCNAGWTGIPGDPCQWCQTSLQRLIADTRTDLLDPPWLTVTHGPRYDELCDDSKLVWDRTRDQVRGDGSAVTWAGRLRRAVEAGLITQSEADHALRRFGVDHPPAT
jgi:hypothetical protein